MGHQYGGRTGRAQFEGALAGQGDRARRGSGGGGQSADEGFVRRGRPQPGMQQLLHLAGGDAAYRLLRVQRALRREVGGEAHRGAQRGAAHRGGGQQRDLAVAQLEVDADRGVQMTFQGEQRVFQQRGGRAQFLQWFAGVRGRLRGRRAAAYAAEEGAVRRETAAVGVPADRRAVAGAVPRADAQGLDVQGDTQVSGQSLGPAGPPGPGRGPTGQYRPGGQRQLLRRVVGVRASGVPGDGRQQRVGAGPRRHGVEEGVVQLGAGHVEGVLGGHPQRRGPHVVQRVLATDDGAQVAGDGRGETDPGEVRRQSRDLGRRARREPQQQWPAPVSDPPPRELLHEFQGGSGGVRLAQRRGRPGRHGESGHHGKPEGHQPVHGRAVGAQGVGVQPADPPLAVRHQGVARHGGRDGGAGRALGDAHPRLPPTSSSSRASSSARLMPSTSSSSWCSRIHTVWYESHSGEASHSTAPSSKRSSASSRSVR